MTHRIVAPARQACPRRRRPARRSAHASVLKRSCSVTRMTRLMREPGVSEAGVGVAHALLIARRSCAPQFLSRLVLASPGL